MIAKAIKETFLGRKRTIPPDIPVGLSVDFANNPTKLSQWHGFVEDLTYDAPTLQSVVKAIRDRAMTLFVLARK